MPNAKPIDDRNEKAVENYSDDDYVIRSRSSRQLFEAKNFATKTSPSRRSRPATAVQLNTTTPANKSARQGRLSQSSVTSTRFYPVLQVSWDYKVLFTSSRTNL